MKEKVLIVDDEMIINLNLKTVLEKNGYEPEFVNSGEKCLEKLRSGYLPDIILMDINLGPERMSGPETTEKIYREYDIPIVLHSAYTDKATLDKTKSMTKYGYIHKVPGNEYFLIATMEMALKLFRTEKELRGNEQKFRQLAENISETFWLSSPSMDELYYVSPAFESTWGIPAETLYENAEAFFEAIVEEDRAAFRKKLEERMPNDPGPIIFPVCSITRQDRGRRWISVRAFPVKDSSGKVYRMAGIAEDVTGRKRMEEALNNAYSDLNEIFNVSVPLCVISVKYDLLRVNDSFCSYFGVKRENIIGRKCHNVIDSPTCFTKGCEIVRVCEGETQASNSFRVVNEEGEKLDTLVTAVPYRNSEGEIIGIVENFIDITELRAAERKLSESEQKYRELSNHLQHVREEQNAYIAREIHDDLGQSLTALKMNLSLLESDLPTVTRSEAAEAHSDDTEIGADGPVKETISEMRKILDDTVTKVREVTKDLRPSVLDTSSIVEAIGWQVQEYGEYADFDIEYNSTVDALSLDKDTSLAVFRIVQEALTNCARHSNADNVSVNVERENGTLRITVSDDGRGFPFEISSNNQSFGLIGMQERASSCGGELTIDSGNGKGTTVTLTVPLGEGTEVDS